MNHFMHDSSANLKRKLLGHDEPITVDDAVALVLFVGLFVVLILMPVWVNPFLLFVK